VTLAWRSTIAPRWMIAGEWRAHPMRIVTATIAIAIGVALGFAVHLVNASALDRFSRGLATVNGGADLRVEATGGRGFDEQLYPRLAKLPGIAAASPVVVLRGRIGASSIDLLGIDALRAAVATPTLLPVPERDAAPAAVFDPRSLFLSRLAMTGHHVGEPIDLVVTGRSQRFTLAGTVPGATARALGTIDIAAAQSRFARLGTIDRIDLKLADGADATRTADAIRAMLPPDATLARASDDADRTDALSRAYRVNLDMLALVALLTGSFLVFSAQALSVARRRPQFALLRVLGSSRRAIVGQVLAEGLVLGIAGAAIGVLLGFALALLVLRLVGGDLGSGAFASGDTPPLIFAPGAAAGFAALGLAAALLGSAIPARSAARVVPAVALKNLGDAIDPRRRPPILPALLLAALGIGAASLPAVGGVALFGYASVGLLLAAGIGAMPWLARALLAPLARHAYANPPLELAVRRLWGAPGQAAVALSGIVASVGLMIAMAVMVASFRHSVDDWLDQILPADLYLTSGGDASLDPGLQAALAHTPGIASIAFALQRPIPLEADRPPPMLIVNADPAHAYPGLGRSIAAAPGTIAIRVSEPASRLYHLSPGSMLTLPLGASRVRATVTGVFRDYARQQGALAIDGATYDRLTGEHARGEAAIHLVRGADPMTAIAALRRTLPPAVADGVQILPVAALKTRALAIFDRSFAITYALEAVAILVGLAGVAATASAQTIARTREFGMLRHLGVTRRQIVAMLGIEGALLGTIGGIAGVALGCAVAQVLIHVINPQSFNWTMDTRVPVPLLAGVMIALALASSLTAMIAGRSAVSIDAVRAVREDW